MKKRLLLLTIPLILVGCTTNKTSSTNSSSSNNTQISSSSEETNFISTSSYLDTGVSVSGILSDIGFCKYAILGKTYNCTITDKNAPSSTVTVGFSNPDIATFEGDLESGFTLNCLKVGGTIMTVKDSTDYLIYRTAINVQKAKTSDEISDYMVNSIRYYNSSMGYDSYKLTFTSATAGVFYAKEGDVDYGSMTFTYTLDPTLTQFIDLYGYNLEVTMDDSKSAILLSSIFVYATGSSTMAYEKNGIVGIFEEVI